MNDERMGGPSYSNETCKKCNTKWTRYRLGSFDWKYQDCIKCRVNPLVEAIKEQINKDKLSMNFLKGQIVYCISELTGYTTAGVGYVVNEILDSTGRLSILDDNGKECHASMKRFLSFEDYTKYLEIQPVTLTRAKITDAWERTRAPGMNANPIFRNFMERLGLS